MTSAWASRFVWTVSATSTRCCGTRWRPSCGVARRSSFHCDIRLDELDDDGEVVAPPARFDEQLLIDAARAAAQHASFLSPCLAVEPGFADPVGSQVDARPLDGETSKLTAGYIAKYATKSTKAVGGLLYRLKSDEIGRLKVRPHVQQFVESAWNLAPRRELHPLKLRRWAHSLGFRGHCFTKRRRYSTTFTALRQARHEHLLRRQGELRDRSCDVRRCTTPAPAIGRRVMPGWPSRTASGRWSSGGWHVRSFGPVHLKGDEVSASGGQSERYITAKKVGERVGLSPETILRYYREGRIPGRRRSGQVRPMRFLGSKVQSVWDCERQLELGVAA